MINQPSVRTTNLGQLLPPTADLTHAPNLSPTSPVTINSIDQKNSISVRDFLFILRHRFLDTLLLDLQPPGAEHRIKGSYALPNLAKELSMCDGAGSAIYALTCNSALRKLLSTLACPFLIAYDLNGTDASNIFSSRFREIAKVTGKKFGKVRWVCYLRGGINAVMETCPSICYPLSVPKGLSNGVVHVVCDDVEEKSKAGKDSDEGIVSCILKGFLFLGGIEATNEKHVNLHQFDAILSLGETPLILEDDRNSKVVETLPLKLTPSSSSLNRRASKHEGIERKIEWNGSKIAHYFFPLEDISHAPIEHVIKQTTEILQDLENRGQRVLVHCFGGVSRSATVVIAFLMVSHNLTLAEAFAIVFQSRPWIRPNEGFWKKLQELEIEERVIKVARAELKKINNPPVISESPKKVCEKSRLMSLIEDDCVTKLEASLTHTSMTSARFDRVTLWSEALSTLRSIEDIPPLFRM